MASDTPRTQRGTSNRAQASSAQHAKPGRSAPGLDSRSDSAPKPSGYGLPCASCRLYYPADLDHCPTCHHQERVSPKVPKVPPKPTEAALNPVSNSTAVEQEREAFLRQFKSQVLAHAEAGNGSAAVCTLGEHRAGDDAGAVICQACYERLEERLDVCVAAIHMDSNEAAQIVYEAVWADPSDPGKTYENAAKALLTEIRKRAGISTPLAPFQPPSD